MQKMKDTLARQFSDFKTQTVDMIKNKLFCCFAVLVALIVPALFLDWAIFVVCAAAVALFVLLKFDDGLAVLLFLYPFFAIFNYGEATLYSVLFDVAVLIFAIKYVVEVVKKEKELNWKLLVILASFVIYALLPIRKDQYGKTAPGIYWTKVLDIMCFLGMVYLIFINRYKIDIVKILKIFLAGFLIANCFGLFHSLSARLQDVVWVGYYTGIEMSRFGGLFVHPNNNAGCAVFALLACLYLIYTRKTNLLGYFFFFVVFTVGYLTMARQFLYVALIAIAVFVVLEIIKNKKHFYKTVLPIVVLVAVVMLIFLDITIAHIDRFTFKDLTDGYDVSNIETQDPGRGGLIKLYLRDYLSSTMIILFGKGITNIYLGIGLAPHNTYLEALWCTGIFGIALTIAILVVLLMAFTKKNFGGMIKTVFCNPVTYLVVLPMMALLFIECFYFNIHMAATFTVFILTLISNQKIEKEKDID